VSEVETLVSRLLDKSEILLVQSRYFVHEVRPL
jgi:hypothetical protein